uniref:Uncharacterized protein n=1 Tax=Solanum lycopersicum TaxID=4081 RepID=A0A3Q7J7Q6_SOLLC
MALEKLDDSFINDYNKLEAYAQEINQPNPGSDVLINISKVALAEGKRKFLKMYICFDDLMKGWKSGLRPFIRLDGTFLKGICEGVLLGSLDLKDGAKITLILDMQKGQIDVVVKVFLEAQHGSYVEEFKGQLNKLGKLSKDGSMNFVKYPPKAWLELILSKSNNQDVRRNKSTGIPCPHAIKALTHKKADPITEIHWWYSKEGYMLTYKNKMQPVRGQKFWKVDPSSEMLPHDVVKQLGKPKMKRNREPDEARKRKGEWSQSRKGPQMTYNNYERQNAMSNNGHGYDVEGGTEAGTEVEAVTQEFEPYGTNVEDEEDSPLTPMVICELEFRTEKLKKRVVPTGARKIQFYGDHTVASC